MPGYEPETCREHRETQTTLVLVVISLQGNGGNIAKEKDILRDELLAINSKLKLHFKTGDPKSTNKSP